jgi:hypothetical protein
MRQGQQYQCSICGVQADTKAQMLAHLEQQEHIAPAYWRVFADVVPAQPDPSILAHETLTTSERPYEP